MEILVFANPNDATKERFFQEISKVPKLSPKLCLESEHFLTLFKKNTRYWDAIVFFCHDRNDLNLALSLRDRVIETRLILVLGEWNDETVKLGLSIAPSLITKADGDFKDVIAVLKKISTIDGRRLHTGHANKKRRFQAS
jgi:hypothetical protein